MLIAIYTASGRRKTKNIRRISWLRFDCILSVCALATSRTVCNDIALRIIKPTIKTKRIKYYD